MNNIKNISLFKIVNIILFVAVLGLLWFMNLNYSVWCSDSDIYCYYNFYDAIYNPLFSAGKIFSIILGLLLFVPAHIFRKWLYYVAPLIILIIINRVQAVSVYSENIVSIDKVHMAQYGMYFLGLCTCIFVATHLISDKRKSKSSE